MVVDLCTASDVRRVAALSNEYSDAIIGSEIIDVSTEIFAQYKPIKRTYFLFDDKDDNVPYLDYDFTGNNGQRRVYKVIKVEVSVPTTIADPPRVLLHEGSGSDYVTHLDIGSLVFGSDIVIEHINREVFVEWIPDEYRLMAAIMTALNLIDGSTIIDGESSTSPQVNKLLARLNRIKQSIKKAYTFNSSKYKCYAKDSARYVDNDEIRNLLY